MISQTSEQRATWLNESFAARVGRWKRCRLAVAIIAAAAGAATIATDFAYACVPLFLIAAGAFLLYLDAREQQAELKQRRWTSPWPQTSRLFDRKSATSEASKPAE